ncbi:MAG: ribbon-helix-helix domain-containing protein [Coriobacteriia bacterium]|nr:ribbon-helix-helix domain-containing protein [Coriobacteriia bacterium]
MMSKKVIGTSNGVEVTEEMLDRWADAFERDEWPEGKTVIIGRPRLAADEVKPVTFRLSVSLLSALDRKAFANGGTRSEALREAVEEYVAS